MCLALPALVVEMSATPGLAWVELGGIRKQISVELVPEAKPGDYVILHVGYGIGILKPEEAESTLALFEQMVRAAAGPDEVLDFAPRPESKPSSSPKTPDEAVAARASDPVAERLSAT